MIAVCGSAWLPKSWGAAESPLEIAGRECAVRIRSISEHALRLTISPIDAGQAMKLPSDGALVPSAEGKTVGSFPGSGPRTVKAGRLSVAMSTPPLAFTIHSESGETVQRLKIDEPSGAVSFLTGDAPLLGLGEGGPQFDRRGSTDAMRSGQGGYRLATNGGRVPIPWLIGTAGWAMFFHQPSGTFDFAGEESKFLPASPPWTLPLDLFVVVSREPQVIMREYARLTGLAEMPPLWSLGYQQSHRTLASREEILSEAKTFREKRLPCDALIYLGTGFCPSGWNTENGSFEWNPRVFPDPKEMIARLHDDHFHVVPHVVILADKLRGTVHDACELRGFDEQDASCYWDMHRADFAMGVDGWWPDEGDPLDAASRLVRNRMYWEGPQIDRPNERPYALHRNGYAGMQRYASFLWSGDVYSTWETLKTHISVAINTGLSGIPYWGTDVGGFVPTKEFTAELYLRWFQFGAFCTLFRCHGRTWKLRLPWGWDTGDPGPIEIRNYDGAAIPDSSQLHNPRVELICRKYLELRYRMLPYLYSAVRECATTGIPVMRGLWLHYSDDPLAVARGDEYLWGRDVLVAPVVEQGATSRRVYLPKGAWYDFWTAERVEGGREIERPVDLETIPLYVRAGGLLPLGPVKQYVDQAVAEPLSITVYPGADGRFQLYEDDGASFDYRRGEWMGIDMSWDDARRALSLKLAAGSRMLPPLARPVKVKLRDEQREVSFNGRPMEVSF
ncbi:MAG TPA: TIM-barrel domain-containing protein [Candidatus Cybelea sp.]|nr:TIM-barrel domain-containing protein [Candidatus Cybelea sp.]